MIGFMEDHRVQVEKRLSRATYPGRDYRGRCYEMCLKYVRSHMDTVPELILVHGVIYIVGLAYEHAWIEFPNGTVFDGTTQHFYDRAAWDRLLLAQVDRRYTTVEVCQQVATAVYRTPGGAPGSENADDDHALHHRLPPPPVYGAAPCLGLEAQSRTRMEDRPQPTTRSSRACLIAP